MRLSACLLLAAALGCVDTRAIDEDLTALRKAGETLAARLESVEREVRRCESRLGIRIAESAASHESRIEELALALSRAGKDAADLRQELGRRIDENARRAGGLEKGIEDAAAAGTRAADERAALKAQVDALRAQVEALQAELARVERGLDALSREAAEDEAPAAPPPAPTESAEL